MVPPFNPESGDIKGSRQPTKSIQVISEKRELQCKFVDSESNEYPGSVGSCKEGKVFILYM